MKEPFRACTDCEHWVGGLSSDGDLEWSGTASELLEDSKNCMQAVTALQHVNSWMRAVEKHTIVVPWMFTTVDCYQMVCCQFGVSLRKKDELWDRAYWFVWNPTVLWEELYVLKFTVADPQYTEMSNHRAVLQIGAEKAVEYLPTALQNHRCLFLKQPWWH